MRKLLLVMGFFLFSVATWAQDRTVSGKVTSLDDGSALPGVNVILKGTTTGTVTDIDGNYSLSVPSNDAVLQFSFVGLASQEVTVGSRSVIDVQMASDVTELTEVVVTAFGVERARDEITYVTEKVSAEDLMQAQQTTAAQGLAGKVAGLQINVQDNGVKPNSQILLRGMRSITANNSALIVIDGVIASQGAFNDLNPNDIASVNVLKGATAGALYGSRAANGVLIVETKKGGYDGKLTIGLNSTYSLEEVAYMPDFQDKFGIGWDGSYDPIENTNWGPRFDGEVRQIGPTFDDGSYQEVPYAAVEDNRKDFYETGNTFQNTLYLSGGDEDSRFYLSLGNQDTRGIVPNDKYKRTTVRINAAQKIGKVELSLNSSYFHDKTNVVGNTIGDQDRPLYWFVLNTPRNIPLSSYKDWQNPESYAYADNYYNAYYQNPYWAVGTNRDIDETSRLNGNFSVSYDITDNINWTSRVGVNAASGIGKNWRARQEYDSHLQPSHSTVSSFVEDYEFKSTEYNGSTIISGDFEINEDFKITPLVGASFFQSSWRDSEIRANNLSIPGFYDISNGTGQLVGSVDESERREYGFFADVTVGFRDFLFLNLSGRQDYTSTLAKDDNGYFYPGVGLSFVVTDAVESLKDNDILSFAKITASNSTVYNDLSPYQINERYTQRDPSIYNFPFPLGSLNGFEVARTAVDASIKKEKLNTTEFGANLGFLNGRFTLDAAYFVTKTTDLITSTTPSVASGSEYYLTNIGELTGTGLELSLGGTVVRAGDFKWRMNLNYTAYETVVNEIKEGLDEVAVDNYTAGYGTFAIKDQPFPQIKAASYVRDPQGRVVVDAETGNPLVGDVIALGKTTPDYIVGLTSQMNWKGLSLSATFDYRTGHVYYEQGSDAMEFTGSSVASASADRQDFVWPNSVIKVGDDYVENTNIPITGGIGPFWRDTYNTIKENYVKDATALKIREIALKYTFPRSFLDRTNVINKLTLGIVSRNLITFLPEENRFADPEFRNTRASDDPNGIGIGGYFQSPPTRTFGFNLNIEF